jgi:CRISPR-associated endonuclease Csn1
MLKNGTAEVTNIIRALWETNDNLMQLLSDNYDFRKKIDEENRNIESTSLKQEIDNLYVSPKIKRPIYQTMQILDEIVKIQGNEPKKIFIEVARGEEKKERKVSRKQRLLDLYKYCKNDEKELYQQLINTDESEFKRDALYLYYTQFGRCMYTNQKIDISEIYNKNLYDIDHIYPRSKIKDDSLDNRVLVTKKSNEDKGNIYPINQTVRDRMIPYWKMLFSKELISKQKYERLVRNSMLTDEELSSFVARQLVETRQSTKAVATLLKKRYPNTNIEYIKAGLASDFRRDFDMLKCRDVNDYHHAKDAYLNIVVGNVYTTKARQSYFIGNLQSGKWSINRMFDYTTNGAWEVENNKSLNIVKSTMAKNNIRFTRYAFKQKGGLFDQNPVKKGSGQVPIKKGMDISKDGGYNRPSSTYFAFVEYVDSKGKTYRSFEPIDLYIEKEYLNNPKEFISNRLGVDDVKIIIPCVKYNALISIDGFRMHLSSKSGGGVTLVCKPAIQLVVSQKQEKYIKKISNYLIKCNELKKEKEVTKYDELSAEENLDLFDTLINKMSKTIFAVKFGKLGNTLTDKRDEFESLSLYSQCYTLMQIINILHANVLSGDLTALGEAKKSGITTISNKLQSSYKSAKIINQSITGLFEQEIDLLK